MGRKKILEKRLAKIQAKIAELRAKMQASEDVVEMRGLAANIDDLTESEADIKEKSRQLRKTLRQLVVNREG